MRTSTPGYWLPNATPASTINATEAINAMITHLSRTF
jgi:hypothetical protein